MKRIAQHSTFAKALAGEKLESINQGSQKAIDPHNVILEDGSPDEVILSTVDQIKPDLLDMGAVARHGIFGLLVGNAAERVLRQVSCSVLTIKP